MMKKLAVLLAVALVTGACDSSGPVSQTKEITKTQSLNEALPAPAKIPTADERFGTDHASHSGAMPGGMPGAAPAMAGGMGAAPAVTWTWTKPDGWDEVPATQFRLANFKVTGAPETECYLSMANGGTEANANRWRKQMSQPDYTPEEFAKLPRKTILGQEAVMLSIDGTFAGMGGTEKKEGYRLAGAIFDYKGSGVFVKMTGPAATVEKEKAHLEAFLDSLKPGAEGAAPAAAAPAMPASGALPAGHPAPDVAGMAGGPTAAPFAWEAPAEWKKGGDRPMRVVTYTAGASGKAECVISMLTGAAGGAEANINRWRGQLGQAALSPEDIAKLPKVKVFGQDSPLVEVSGPYTGMDGGEQAGYMLLGALGEIPGNKVFIKMVGPEAEVKAEKEHFIAFCQSLK